MKFQKKYIISAAILLALGAAVYVNWQFTTHPSASAKELGAASYVNATVASTADEAVDAAALSKEGRNYFASERTKRQSMQDKVIDEAKELLKLDRALKRFPYAKSDYLVNAMGAWKFNEMFHKKYYGEGRPYPFEDTTVWGPEDFHHVCTQLYGDYMTPPKDADKNHHQSEIIVE